MTAFEPSVDTFAKVKDLVSFIDQIPAEDSERLRLLLEAMEFGELRIPADLIGRLNGRIPASTAAVVAPSLPSGRRGSAWMVG